MKTNTEQQIVALFIQAMRTALALINNPAQRAATPTGKAKAVAPGIFPHKSKYNPWRAYAWNKTEQKTIYLGVFSSVNKAKLAQRAYRNNQPFTASNKPPLRVVKSAQRS